MDTTTTFDAEDWRRRVEEVKAILDPVERREKYEALLEEYESAQAWVREMERDMAFLRGQILQSLDQLDRIFRGEKIDDEQ